MNKNINQSVWPLGMAAGATTRTKYFLYILAVCLLPAIGITSCKSNKPAQVTAQQNVDSLNAVQAALQNQFSAAQIQVDQLTTQKSRLDSLISLKDAEIAKLKKEVGHLGKDRKELAMKVKSGTRSINSLRDEMDNRSKDYEHRLSILQTDRDNLAMQNDSLVKKYNALRELGSVLDASNFRLEAIHLKHHGRKEKLTKRARKADILRVEFDIDENRIAESGVKNIYLVMKDPAGQLLSNKDNSSGSIMETNGTKVSYSTVKEVMLRTNVPVKDVTVDWKQDGDYKKGDYSIALYNGGYRIGGGTVRLN